MNRVMEIVSAEEHEKWTGKRLAKMIVSQTWFHSIGLFLLPLSLAVLLPFGYVYGIIQNFSLLGSGKDESFRETLKKSKDLAVLWPKQNHILIWLLSPSALFLGLLLSFFFLYMLRLGGVNLGSLAFEERFFLSGIMIVFIFPFCTFGTIIAVNIGIVLISIPYLLHTLLGIETPFTLSGFNSFLNTTFLLVVFGLTYLFLDPLVKIAYVLRCFQGLSLKNGNDLLVKLRMTRLKSALIVVFIFLLGFFAFPSSAQEGAPQVSIEQNQVLSSDLDQAITEVLKHKKFTWRVPREKPLETEIKVTKEESWFHYFLQGIVDTIKDIVSWVNIQISNIVSWIRRILRRPEPDFDIGSPSGSWMSNIQILYYILIALVGSILGVMIYRLWKGRSRRSKIEAEPIEFIVPDLEDEETVADALPDDEWMTLAKEMMEKREYRLALRAFYLSILAFLSQREMIFIAKYKSNRDYKKELDRRGHAYPELPGVFSENVAEFEKGWYGNHPVTETILHSFKVNIHRIQDYFNGTENNLNSGTSEEKK